MVPNHNPINGEESVVFVIEQPPQPRGESGSTEPQMDIAAQVAGAAQVAAQVAKRAGTNGTAVPKRAYKPPKGGTKQYGRARVSNGSEVLHGLNDGRTVWVRRIRD